MSRTAEKTIALLLIATVALLLWVLFWRDTLGDFVSPGGTYRVVLSGDDSRPFFESYVAEVRLCVYKGEELWVKDWRIFTADFLSTPFRDLYPKRTWDGESVFRLGEHRGPPSPMDTLLVANHTGKTLQYLDIVRGDRLFIFDLLPREERLFEMPQSSPATFVGCRGEFADGKEFKHDGVVFENRGTPRLDMRLIIQEQSVVIDCLQVEGHLWPDKVPNPRIVPKARLDDSR